MAKILSDKVTKNARGRFSRNSRFYDSRNDRDWAEQRRRNFNY